MALQAITIPPASGQPPRGTVVILHGWGASAKDVWSLASLVDLPDFQLVFPDAPFSHPYSAGGKMWYDFPNHFNFQSTSEFRTRKDLSTSRQLLIDLLKELATTTGVPLSHTVLGGFSQGGAMTLDVGLGLPLAGLMVLSGYLHAPIVPPQAAIPPVLMIHGKQDSVVPLAAAQQALASLRSLGADVRYQEFDMGHEIQPIVLKLIQSFVEELLPNNK
ncbi:alpha/beta fold hydrolase [Phormidium sp. FACHB-592]|uniref:Alpha/beta fold hydrolase n=1 Tax=Stenomitos frigidus AS-A4 TaxID=2933935 RepID=A0ABV0KS50_9CYAN|nr:alpha/beta fold hydrolase [Phormidium sp. FACHB-592]MBD2075211.1 alpha/beta fold hydrolase [Phormidium sp. FACHB-592]